MKTFDKNRNHTCMRYIQMQSNIEVDVGKKPGKKVGDTSTEMVSMNRFFFSFLARFLNSHLKNSSMKLRIKF